MSRFPGLGAEARVPDILRLNPEAGEPLLRLHEAALRGPSPLSVAERELIAAFVSALNGCVYCHGMHDAAAAALGVAPGAAQAAVEDLEGAPVEARMRPLLAYLRKLTEAPASLEEADAEAVFAAGWDARALHDAILAACLFNFMNRLIEGHGLRGDAAMFRARGPAIARHGYLPLIEMIRR